MAILIKLEDLTVRRGRKEVLNGWNLNIDSAEVVVLSGENGCGKSTVIEAAAGLLNLENGSSQIQNQTIRDSEGRRGRTNFGLCLQNDCVMGDELVGEKLLDAAQANFDVKSLLDEWKLGHRINDKIAFLSGGQRRKIAVLSALVPALISEQPIAVLLDEPDSGLDDDSIERLVQLLRDLAAGGHAILVASHNQKIKNAANRVISFPFSEKKQSPIIGTFNKLESKKSTTKNIGLRLNIRTMSGLANNGIAGLLVLGSMLAFVTPNQLGSEMLFAFILAPALAAGLNGDPIFKLLQENRAHAWWYVRKAIPPNAFAHVFLGCGLLTILSSAIANHWDAIVIISGATLGLFTAIVVTILSHATLRLARPNAVMLRLLTPILILPWAILVSRLS